ncbi:MAG TPA: zinc dependent phospholipase C family protein [Terriglobales bacterium]|nr:zinc dependent phospholipase C family protein [Terriglobales bacterium]
MRKLTSVLLIALLINLAVPTVSAYSVLTHEEVVDLLWLDQIRPLLLQRYPGMTTEQLKQAHAYAYGGCLIQDMGYYPFGNKLFSDLVHYVRSGDFVVNLLNEAQDSNQYAFALGALAHYTSDTTGHPAVNESVGREFPKLRRKFGDEPTYEDNPKAHIQTEFGFDVVQVAKQRYTSDSYHDFIGFQVSKPLLERAFRKTYGLELSDVFGDEDRAIGSFRRAVSKIIPEMTKVALATHKVQLVKENPNFTKQKFLYNLSRAEYQRDWGGNYQRPGIGTRILAFILRIVPKVGPFKALAIKTPDAKTEDIYLKSVNSTIDQYKAFLADLRGSGLRLENRDLDTGKPTSSGEYKLGDKTYLKLLDKLAEKNFATADAPLQQNILAYFQASPTLAGVKQKRDVLAKRQKELASLKQLQAPSDVLLK